VSPRPVKAVVLARGLGTRMRRESDPAALTPEQAAAARTGAKAMMPIAGAGRPFLDYVLSALADAGWTDVCLVVPPEHDAIRDYYTRVAPPHRIAVTLAVQSEPRGTADALLAAESWAGRNRFLVVNGDNYYPVSALRAVGTVPGAGACLFARDTLVSLGNIPPDRVRAFAVCRLTSDGTLAVIVEKPETTAERDDLVSMNCWVMPPAVFEAARSIAPSVRGELEIADAVTWLMREEGVRFDVIVSDEGVLDLSLRSDVTAVARVLSEVDAAP